MIVLIVIAVLVILWLGYFALVSYVNDLSLPVLDMNMFRKPGKPLTILAVYPHPDDETMAAGGTLAKYAHAKDTRVVVLTTTRGEQGETAGYTEQSKLGEWREGEFRQAMTELGVTEYMLWHFPDSGMDKVMAEVDTKLVAELQRLDPDVVITYDASGLYGHPDHIALSLSLQRILKEKFPQVKLLFSTLPAKMIKMAHLPNKITLQDRVIDLDHGALQRTLPKFRVNFWRYAGNKTRAIAAHRSQSLLKVLPPLWIYRHVGWIEYYSEA